MISQYRLQAAPAAEDEIGTSEGMVLAAGSAPDSGPVPGQCVHRGNCKLKSVNFKLQIGELAKSIVEGIVQSAKPCGILLGVLGVAAILYVLSYSPFIRYSHGNYRRPTRVPYLASWEFNEDVLRGTYPAYAPVEWLIDNTVLSRPLNAWARICGVEEAHSDMAHNRRIRARVAELERLLGANPAAEE